MHEFIVMIKPPFSKKNGGGKYQEKQYNDGNDDHRKTSSSDWRDLILGKKQFTPEGVREVTERPTEEETEQDNISRGGYLRNRNRKNVMSRQPLNHVGVKKEMARKNYSGYLRSSDRQTRHNLEAREYELKLNELERKRTEELIKGFNVKLGSHTDKYNNGGIDKMHNSMLVVDGKAKEQKKKVKGKVSNRFLRFSERDYDNT